MATLKSLPFDPVRFACRACGRELEVDKDTLISQYGDLPLPEIRLAVARACGCESADATGEAPPCGIVYSDLVGLNQAAHPKCAETSASFFAGQSEKTS